MKKCKKCKHCHQFVDNLTLAYGGFSYLCDLEKGKNSVVGDYDIIYNKEHWKEYGIQSCNDFEEKAPKPVIWNEITCHPLSFELENDKYYVEGHSGATSIQTNTAWCLIRIKDTDTKYIFYLAEANYCGIFSEDLEDEIDNYIVQLEGVVKACDTDLD